MSNELMVITPEQLMKQAEELASRFKAVSSDTIRVEEKQFIFPDGTSLKEMDAVILDFAFVNSFYKERYNPKKPAKPVCRAANFSEFELVPDENAPEPQAESCAECPNNQFGSDGAGKACKNEIHLALIPVDATEMTAPMLLRLPPTSLTPFKRYVRTMTSLTSTPLYGVITHFSFDPDVTYGKIICSNPNMQRNPNLEIASMKLAEAAAMLLQPFDFTPPA